MEEATKTGRIAGLAVYITVPLPTIVSTILVTQPQFIYMRDVPPSCVAVVVHVERMDISLNIDSIQHVIFLNTAFSRHLNPLMTSFAKLKRNSSRQTGTPQQITTASPAVSTHSSSQPRPMFIVKISVESIGVTIVINKLGLRLALENGEVFLVSKSPDARPQMGQPVTGGALCINAKAGMSTELHDKNRQHPTSFWGKVSTKVAVEVKSRSMQKHNGKSGSRSRMDATSTSPSDADSAVAHSFVVVVDTTDTMFVLRQSAVDKGFQFFLDYRHSYEHWKGEFEQFGSDVQKATDELRDDLNMQEQIRKDNTARVFDVHITVERSCLVVPMGSLIDLSLHAPATDWPEQALVVQIVHIELHAQGAKTAVGNMRCIRMGFHDAFSPYDEVFWTVDNDLEIVNEPDFPKRQPDTFDPTLNLLMVPYATFQYFSHTDRSDSSVDGSSRASLEGAAEVRDRGTETVQLATEFVVGGIMVHVCSEIGLWIGRLHYTYVVLRRQVNELSKANESVLGTTSSHQTNTPTTSKDKHASADKSLDDRNNSSETSGGTAKPQINRLKRAQMDHTAAAQPDTGNSPSAYRPGTPAVPFSSLSTLLGRWVLHITLKIERGRMVLYTPAIQNQQMAPQDTGTGLLPLETVKDTSTEPVTVMLPSFTVKGVYVMQGNKGLAQPHTDHATDVANATADTTDKLPVREETVEGNIRQDANKQHVEDETSRNLFVHVHLGSFSDNITFRPNLIEFIDMTRNNYDVIADEVYDKYQFDLLEAEQKQPSVPTGPTPTNEEALGGTLDAMAQNKTNVVLIWRMDSSTFNLSCLPKSLIHAMIRLPSIDIAYSKSLSFADIKNTSELLDMHCLTVNLAQALIKVHHPYSSAVSFQLDLSSVRFNIALDRHMLKPTNHARSRRSTVSALRAQANGSSTSSAVLYGAESGYSIGSDDVLDSETLSSLALSQRQSVLSTGTATTTGTSSKRRVKRSRPKNKRLVATMQVDVDKTSLLYNTRQLDELLQFMNMWITGKTKRMYKRKAKKRTRTTISSRNISRAPSNASAVTARSRQVQHTGGDGINNIERFYDTELNLPSNALGLPESEGELEGRNGVMDKTIDSDKKVFGIFQTQAVASPHLSKAGGTQREISDVMSEGEFATEYDVGYTVASRHPLRATQSANTNGYSQLDSPIALDASAGTNGVHQSNGRDAIDQSDGLNSSSDLLGANGVYHSGVPSVSSQSDGLKPPQNLSTPSTQSLTTYAAAGKGTKTSIVSVTNGTLSRLSASRSLDARESTSVQPNGRSLLKSTHSFITSPTPGNSLLASPIDTPRSRRRSFLIDSMRSPKSARNSPSQRRTPNNGMTPIDRAYLNRSANTTPKAKRAQMHEGKIHRSMSSGYSAHTQSPLVSRPTSGQGQLTRNGLPIAAIPSLRNDEGRMSDSSATFYDATELDQEAFLAASLSASDTDTEGYGGSFAGSFEGSSSEDDDGAPCRDEIDVKVYTPKQSMFADPLTLAVCVRLKKYTVTTNLGQAIGKAVYKNKNLLMNFSLNTHPPQESKRTDRSGRSNIPPPSRSEATTRTPTTSHLIPSEAPVRPTLDAEVCLRVYLAAAELSSAGQKEHTGLLNGVFGVSNIEFVGSALLPANADESSTHPDSIAEHGSKAYPCLNTLTLSVENMDASIKYHSNPILILDVSDFKLDIKDRWAWRTSVGATSATADGDNRFLARGVDIDIDSNYIYIILSKETIPSFANVAKKIQRLVQEQVSRFAGTRTATAPQDGTMSELLLPAALEKLQANVLLPLLNGTVSIGGEEILVACFWHSFMDPSWALFHLRAYEVHLVQRMNGKFANRQCDITLGAPDTYSLSVRQMNGPVGTAKVYNLDIEEWIDRVVEAQSSHKIIHAGQMHMRLRSHHNLMSPIIQIKMVTEFPDSIEVSLDVSMYLWIKQLVNLYMDEAKQRGMERHPSTGDRRASETSMYEDAVNSSTGKNLDNPENDDLQPSPFAQRHLEKFGPSSLDDSTGPRVEDITNGVGVTPTSVVPAGVKHQELERDQGTNKHAHQLRYETLQFVLNPELTIASYGGSNFAPPDIEWLLSKLGFKNSRLTIPKEIHEILVDNLVNMLNLYATQTSDHEVVVVTREETNYGS